MNTFSVLKCRYDAKIESNLYLTRHPGDLLSRGLVAQNDGYTVAKFKPLDTGLKDHRYDVKVETNIY